jgi:predicted dehydrogenase
MSEQRLRIALAGDGDEARTWASALREQADLLPLPDELPAGFDALVLAAGTHDPFALAKQALQAGLPVLYAAPFLLNPWQAARLSLLAGRQRRLLRFVEPFQHRQGFPFLHRLLQGREPFWRPLYLRLLCIAGSDDQARIDELATEQLAICDVLLNDEPRHVTAAAVRNDLGDICAAFLTLQYEGGTMVQLTISLAEAESGRQLVAVAPGRTVVLDDLDPVASVRIAGSEHETLASGGGLAPRGERGHNLIARAGAGPVHEEAKAFLGAVASGSLSSANGERWARVAALWWAARQSMISDGPVEVPAALFQLRSTEPPPLTVIEGGGKTVRTARPRPSLTVVNG